MKTVAHYLQEQGTPCRSLKAVIPKELGTRKKIAIYLCVDMQKYYRAIFMITKKSRILRKEANEIMALQKKLEEYMGTRITKNDLLVDAPICSKAKGLLESNGWAVTLVS